VYREPAFALESEQSFANRRAAHLEPGRDLAFGKPIAREQAKLEDSLFDPMVDRFRQ